MNKIEFIMQFISDFDKFVILANQLCQNEINELAKEVIETKNAEYIYYFARDVKKAPIDELAKGIHYTSDKEFIDLFDKKFIDSRKSEKKQLEQMKKLLQSKSPDIAKIKEILDSFDADNSNQKGDSIETGKQKTKKYNDYRKN